MKVLRTLLLAVVAVAAVVALALAVVIATFDPNKYRPEIAAAVKDKTGRTLAIEGSLGLSVFPSLGISVGKASLSEPNSSRIFARVEEAKASVALLPLFSRQVVVDRVMLSGLATCLVKRFPSSWRDRPPPAWKITAAARHALGTRGGSGQAQRR